MSFKQFLKKYYSNYNIQIIDIQEFPNDNYYNCQYIIKYNNKQYSNIYSDYDGYMHMNFVYINDLINSKE